MPAPPADTFQQRMARCRDQPSSAWRQAARQARDPESRRAFEERAADIEEAWELERRVGLRDN